MKKVLSVLLALLMLMFSVMVVNAETTEIYETADGHYKYTLEDGKATLVYTNDEYEQPIVDYTVPETVDGYPIVGIASSAYGELTYIYNLTIPDCIEFIENGAFDMLPNLETVKIGSGVKEMGSAFGYCGNLTKIEVSEDNEHFVAVDNVLFTKDMKTLIQYPAGLTAEEYIVPDGVEEIYFYAFEGNHKIVYVTLPEGLKKIGNRAFDDCHKLLGVYVPTSVTEFGEYMFDGADEFKVYCLETSEMAKFAKENSIYCEYIVVTSLKLNATTIKWPVGKAGHFKPTILPAEASQKLEWISSNPEVATVNENGKLTAVAPGTTTITCKTTDGSNLKATCKVTVGNVVTSLKLNATSITWPVGKAGHFKPTVSPSDAMNKTLNWTSSNSSVATVDANGKLTAVGEGTAVITCKTTDGSNLSATCRVTVKSNIATSLKLNATKINWPVGKAGHFKPTVLPAECASQKLEWTSSNPAVATVNENGKLTAVSAGTTTITCKTTDGSNLKATCTVTVGKLVTSLKLNATKITWPAGKSGSFKPTVSPSDASNKKLSWTSSNPAVATVSASGKLTAVAPGTTTITCKTTDGSNKTATCTVTVTGVKATSLKLNASSITWTVGKSGSFKPTVLPENATNKNLSWESLNPYVATVSSTGKLTAVAPGTAKIVCKTTDGSNLVAYCQVLITDGANPTINYINFFKNYVKDGTYAINGTVDYVDEYGAYMYSTDLQFGVTAKQCYMYEVDQDGYTKTFSGPDGTFMILYDINLSDGFTLAEARELGLPTSHFYVEKDYYIHIDDTPLDTVLLENLTFKSRATEVIDGIQCTEEVFEGETDGSEISFYFDKTGKLRFINFDAEGISFMIKVTSVQGTFKYSDYKVPSGSVEIDGDVWGCLL